MVGLRVEVSLSVAAVTAEWVTARPPCCQRETGLVKESLEANAGVSLQGLEVQDWYLHSHPCRNDL